MMEIEDGTNFQVEISLLTDDGKICWFALLLLTFALHSKHS